MRTAKQKKTAGFIMAAGLLLAFGGLLRERQAWKEGISKGQVQDGPSPAEIEGQEAAHVEEDKGSIPLSATFFAMDTVVTIEVYDGEEGAVGAAKELIGRLERKWSATEAGSEVYELDHSQGTFRPISEETQELLSFALAMAEETKGAFNPLLYPVVKAWGFTTRGYRIPEEGELKSLLSHTDPKDVILGQGMAALGEGMEIDLGAVAKGYAGDLVIEELERHGVTSGIVNLGGNVALLGSPLEGGSWRVGIRSPYGEGNIGILEASDCHIITSGGYERYFTGEDGEIYWHILDPKDGYPADSGLISATILGAEGRSCDALSTAVFVMGREQAEDLWRSRGDFEMILITEDDEIYVTEGIEGDLFLNEMSRGILVHVIKR